MTDATQVRVGTTGAIYVGSTGATAPTSATSALTGFTNLGYVSADGIEMSIDRSTNQIRAWQDSALIREVVTEATATLTFTLLESNADVLALYYGANVDVTDGSVEVNPAATGGRKAFVIDVVDGADAIRTFLPAAEVLSVEAQTVANGEPVSYGVTVTAYVGPDGYSFKKFYSALVD